MLSRPIRLARTVTPKATRMRFMNRNSFWKINATRGNHRDTEAQRRKRKRKVGECSLCSSSKHFFLFFLSLFFSSLCLCVSVVHLFLLIVFGDDLAAGLGAEVAQGQQANVLADELDGAVGDGQVGPA